MKRLVQLLFILLVSLAVDQCWCFSEQGKWSFAVQDKKCHYFEMHTALYRNSAIDIKVTCDPGYKSTSTKIKIGWVVRKSPCYEEYQGPEITMPDFLRWYYGCPTVLLGDFGYNDIEYLKTEEVEVECNHIINLMPVHEKFKINIIGQSPKQECHPSDLVCDSSPSSPYSAYFLTDTTKVSYSDNKLSERTSSQIVKRDADSQADSQSLLTTKLEAKLQPSVSPVLKAPSDLRGDHQVQVTSDGVYLLVLFMNALNGNTFNATVDVEMKGPHGYLSAVDYPLLLFYGIMCIVYVFYAICWLVVSFLQWRDLLRIQFWIGAVIFLGMIEKAVFYAEYQSINSTGQSVRGAIFFAEILSCFKRTLARMLIIIVSFGFGIVKPRLGPILHRVVCIGGLYFVLGSVEAALRLYKPKNDPTNQTLMAGIPLAVLDSIICWWVFSSLVQTTRTLRLRRNVVKLHLYKQFTNTLIFAVLASVAFMVWQIHHHKLTTCLTDWKQLWVDDAYWHVLFSAVLLVIMVLWRPTNNNQRYAFTPLLDMSDDEEDDRESQIAHEAFDGMKMRQQKNSINHSEQNNIQKNANTPKESVISRETEENLKWIEENIPTSLVDAALPALIDSDEEIMTTKFERNKME